MSTYIVRYIERFLYRYQWRCTIDKYQYRFIALAYIALYTIDWFETSSFTVLNMKKTVFVTFC